MKENLSLHTSISKNAYNDKLDDIVNKYNDTHHGIIDVKSNTYIGSSKEMNNKKSKFKIQNIKTFLQKVTLQIGQKTFS